MSDPGYTRNIALRFLRLFCPTSLIEEIEGDLMQRYQRDLELIGGRKAKWKLFLNTLRFLRPGIVLRNKFSFNQNELVMLNNYLKTSLRHIKKSKVNFGFKIGGLALAMFSFLAIALYVSFQLSFDRYHEDFENIYRVNSQRREAGEIEKFAIAPLGLGAILQHEIPEIRATSRLMFGGATYIRYDNNIFDCENLAHVDSSLFDVLTFQFIKGNKEALKKPNSIVLTRRMANTMFGTTDVLQKLVSINREPKLYEVTAVIEDVKPNSHLFVSALIPLTRTDNFNLKSISDPIKFADESATLYVRFSSPVNEGFQRKVESVLDRFVKRSDRTEFGFSISFQPIKDIYLEPQYRAEFTGKGSPVYVYAFSILGILLLVVAAINYINLTIADFGSRARETGVRKVLGAKKYQLVFQVALETVIFSALSLAVGLFLLYLLFPQVIRLLDQGLSLGMLLDGRLLIICISGFMMLIILSSWFPAQQFAHSEIAKNLKSKMSGQSFVNQALLVIQFSVSAMCIACTIIAGLQVSYIHNKELGIDRKDLLVFSLPQEFTVSQMKALKQKLKEVNGVTHVSNSSFRIGGGYWKDWYSVESKDGFKEIELYEVFSDDELFSTLKIKLLEGRTFKASMPADSGAAFVINETCARELSYDDPIGKRIYTHAEEPGKWDGTIVGVVSDINISPLYEKVRPLVMRLPWQSDYPDFFVYVRYEGDEQSIVEAIGKKYKEVNPGYPFHFRFVDELYNSTHEKEIKAFASLQFSTFVIIIVSMLGIFSMAAFISMRRMKEFGIRKVLGASSTQIANLHLGYFVRLVVVANLIAIPVSYVLIKYWLDTFAYRIDLTVLPFILVIGTSLLLVTLSGSYSAWKAGHLNPVDAIKMD